MGFKCLRCGYIGTQKNHILRHLEKKKSCDSNISNITQKDCIKIIKEDDKDFAIEKLLSEIEKLKKTIINLNNSGDNCNIINGDISGNNNNIYNIEIKVNAFDKTDYSVLKNNISSCIKDGVIDEAKLIKFLHFNKEHPENHNVKITNKRDNNIKVFNGEKFEESEYKGKDGIWKFGQDTLKKAEEHQILDDEKYFDNIEDDDNIVSTKEKRDRTNKIGTVIRNGEV